MNMGNITSSFIRLFKSGPSQYVSIKAEDDDGTLMPVPMNPYFSWKKRVFCGLCCACLLVLSGLGGYLLGTRPNHNLLAPIGDVTHTFYYNRPFGQPPNNESAYWWHKVFPRGRGFIYNPTVSPDVVGLSVFHQLHCLDAIRRSYYAALDGTTEDHGNTTAAGHTRHCIDYLRQSIMCHADTNLEPIDPDLGGVTGWGNARQCRDIVGLIAWADKWRTHDQVNIASK